MLIRDIHHPLGNKGRIAIHRFNVTVFINEQGVIDAEKAQKINPSKPKGIASSIVHYLLQSSRYQKLNLETPASLKKKKAAAAPAPAAAQAPAATAPALADAGAPANDEAQAADGPPAEEGAPAAEGAPATEGGLPATPQSGDLETLTSVLAAKRVSELSVDEIKAALKTGKVPIEKAQTWFAQESARKPKRKQRATLLRALQSHLKRAA